jgi:protein-disulfide isomerase
MRWSCGERNGKHTATVIMRNWLAALLLLGGSLLALAAGRVLYRNPTVVSSVDTTKSNSLPSTAAQPLHVRGAPNSPVTIEEFADFECPPCGALFSTLSQVEKEAGPTVRVVFRHHPLAMHPHAKAAAAAAEAAGLQGRFWELHDLLYQEQAVWANASNAQAVFDGYAKRLGLDVGRFERDCGSSEVKAIILADEKRGAELNVSLTPTVFVNDWAVPRSAYSVAGLRSRIGMMLAIVDRKPSS